MPSRSSGFSHLLAPGLRKVFFEQYNMWPQEFSQVFNMESSSRSYEEDSEVTGLGKMPEKPEGRSIAYDDPFQADQRKRYTHVAFGLGFRVTEELFNDDLYRIINRMPSALARSARQTQEVESWNIFNNGFTTEQTIDGVSLFNTAHPNIARDAGSGPFANRPATEADLAVTSLQAAIENFENTTDDRDLNLMIKPSLMIVAPENKWMARELLNSTKKPHTADNEINALQDEDLKFMVSHYLTDTDAWFLVGRKADHSLTYFTRKSVVFDNDDDFDSGDAKFKGSMRFSVGATGWRGTYGTQGA
jgi:phage major head subunit gpT-like protein